MLNEVKKQNKLIGFNEEFNLIKGFFNDKEKSNKLLFSGIKGIGKATFAYHLINYALSLKEDFKYNVKNNTINSNNRSYKLIKSNSHPNLFTFNFKDNKASIEVSKIREMIEFANKSSFNDDIKIILIDNVEFLNKSSSNALLKILEEENTKLFFILIQNSRKKILETIKSRCLKFNLKLNKKYKNEILYLFMDKN